MTMNETGKRLTQARGSQPVFFNDPTHDVLVGMIVALMGEVSMLRDRLDAHERLAEKQNVFSKSMVDEFVPDEGVRGERQEFRSSSISRVFSIITERLDPDRLSKEHSDYSKILKYVADTEK